MCVKHYQKKLEHFVTGLSKTITLDIIYFTKEISISAFARVVQQKGDNVKEL